MSFVGHMIRDIRETVTTDREREVYRIRQIKKVRKESDNATNQNKDKDDNRVSSKEDEGQKDDN